jgi:hypothetical protein
MHRMDLARAVRADPVLTADHDGLLVADITAEWAGTHGEPFVLTLSGPARGRYRRGHRLDRVRARRHRDLPNPVRSSRRGRCAGPFAAAVMRSPRRGTF